MSFSKKVQVQCQTSLKGYYLLSVYHMDLNAFLSLVPKSTINNLSMYWMDADKDYVSRLKYPVPLSKLNFQFDGLDIQILTVEIELDNNFIIDTNISDELFCRVPPDYPVIELMHRIKTVDPAAIVLHKDSSSISSLSPEEWITVLREE